MNEFPSLACSLSPDERVEREHELRELCRRALVGRDREQNAVVLTYRLAHEAEEALRDLISREAECCPFLGFELAADDRELSLRVSAPPGAEGMLDLIYRASTP
jgi:hypothetical protein